MRVKALPVALVGLVLAGIGFFLWVSGDEDAHAGQARLTYNTAPGFGDVLGFSADEESQAEARDAMAQVDSGEQKALIGKVTLGVGGALLLGSFFLAVNRSKAQPRGRPATVVATPVPSGDPAVPRAPCPTCGESIPVAAKVCRFCGRDVPAGALRAPQ